eukprot:GHVP01064642.1.p1 GENE.GHVP01064642.1~~GHVP01064642.1.p1  ORF type:complete len:379 (+),score=73.18 GHVP01064642.1:13-1149(+)
MQPDKWHDAVRKVVDDAQNLAKQRFENETSPLHLISVMISNPHCLLGAAVRSSEGSFLELQKSVVHNLNLLPTVKEKPVCCLPDRTLQNILSTATTESDKEKSPCTTTKHLTQVLLTKPDICLLLVQSGFSVSKIMDKIAAAPVNVQSRGTENAGWTSTLKNLTVDLTEQAKNGELEPCIGRDEEIERLFVSLLRKSKNNPLLIGDPGVGKTAIVEGLCTKIVDGYCPIELKDCKILSLTASKLVAGTSSRGDFEARMELLLSELENSDDIILFVDEIHQLLGAGATGSGSLDAANILKPVLARGRFRMIGATTTSEYKKYVETDSAFARRFLPIDIREPSETASIEIIQGLLPRFERFHDVKIENSAAELAVSLSNS